MVLIRLEDPSPDHPYSRTIIPVKRLFATSGWAVFRNGGYEFHVDQALHASITEGETALHFDLEDGRPVAIRLVEPPEQFVPN